MAEKNQLILYAAAYESVERALTDLDAIEQLHKAGLIGQFDAAVIDKEDGRPHRCRAAGYPAHPRHP